MLRKIEGRRRRGRQRMIWLDASLTHWTWFGWTLGVGDGQGGLVCCGSWSHKESDTTEQLNSVLDLCIEPLLVPLYY